MVYTPIETIALILIVVAAIKIVVVLIKPSAWYNAVAKPIWKTPKLMALISLILAAIVLYYLLQELTIVQILAVTMFVALLMAVGFASYKKEGIGLADKMLKDKAVVKKSWLYILIWAALIIWGAVVLFGIA